MITLAAIETTQYD